MEKIACMIVNIARCSCAFRKRRNPKVGSRPRERFDSSLGSGFAGDGRNGFTLVSPLRLGCLSTKVQAKYQRTCISFSSSSFVKRVPPAFSLRLYSSAALAARDILVVDGVVYNRALGRLRIRGATVAEG